MTSSQNIPQIWKSRYVLCWENSSADVSSPFEISYFDETLKPLRRFHVLISAGFSKRSRAPYVFLSLFWYSPLPPPRSPHLTRSPLSILLNFLSVFLAALPRSEQEKCLRVVEGGGVDLNFVFRAQPSCLVNLYRWRRPSPVSQESRKWTRHLFTPACFIIPPSTLNGVTLETHLLSFYLNAFPSTPSLPASPPWLLGNPLSFIILKVYCSRELVVSF